MMMKAGKSAGPLLFLILLALIPGPREAVAEKLQKDRHLDIAASKGLESAVAVLTTRFEATHPGVTIRTRFEPPRRLEDRARTGRDDLILSAGAFETGILLREGHLDPEFTAVVALDRLVLCAPNTGRLRTPQDLATGSVQRVALPDPSRMASGLMAVVALNKIGIWPVVASKIVTGKNTLEVEDLIAAGNVEAGFLYLSDVTGTKRFRIVGTLERPYSDPIAWTAAVTRKADHAEAARAFVLFLKTAETGSLLEGMGLVLPLR